MNPTLAPHVAVREPMFGSTSIPRCSNWESNFCAQFAQLNWQLSDKGTMNGTNEAKPTSDLHVRTYGDAF